MNVILLLLYFTTAPSQGPKDEKNSIWMLQSTSQIEFKSSDACHKIGRQLIAAVKPVATMTVRAYCLCENGNGKVCDKDTIHNFEAMTAQQRKDLQLQPTVEALGAN